MFHRCVLFTVFRIPDPYCHVLSWKRYLWTKERLPRIKKAAHPWDRCSMDGRAGAPCASADVRLGRQLPRRITLKRVRRSRFSHPANGPAGTRARITASFTLTAVSTYVYMRSRDVAGVSQSIAYGYVALHSRAPLGVYGRLGQWGCSYATHGMEPIQCISVSCLSVQACSHP